MIRKKLKMDLALLHFGWVTLFLDSMNTNQIKFIK